MKLGILILLLSTGLGFSQLHAEENLNQNLYSAEELELEIGDFDMTEIQIENEIQLGLSDDLALLNEARRGGAPRPPRPISPRPPRRVAPRPPRRIEPPRRPLPPRRPQPRPPHRRDPGYYTCYAENYRGQIFSASGFWPSVVQDRAIDNCYRQSQICYELGCN